MGYPAQVGMGAWYDDWLYNIGWMVPGRGTLSPDQVEAIAQEEARAKVKASGGRLSYEEALREARAATRRLLMERGADPSQAPGFSDLTSGVASILKWGAIGLGALLVILIVKD